MKPNKDICGMFVDTHYDNKISKLNFELIIDKIGTPLIRIENASKKGCPKLVDLHIKEAIEIKSIIDTLVLDYLWEGMDLKIEGRG